MVDTRIVEIRSAIIPIKRMSPLVTRYGTNEFLPAVVVKIVTQDGIIGIGPVSYTHLTLPTTPYV